MAFVALQNFTVYSAFSKPFVRLGEKNSDSLSANDFLFDEYEIVTEVEPKNPEESYEHENEIYKDYLSNKEKREENLKLDKELRKIKQKDVDEYFINFKERIKRDPEQVHMFLISYFVYLCSGFSKKSCN